MYEFYKTTTILKGKKGVMNDSVPLCSTMIY